MTAERMVGDGNPARVFDIVGAPRSEVDRFLQGYTSGFLAGVERGRQLADDEANAAHQPAYRVVQAMARLEPHADSEGRRRARQVAAAESLAHGARPLPPESAPIHQPRRDGTGCGGRCSRVGDHETCAGLGQGWPLDVVLTPAEAAHDRRVVA